MRARTFIVWPVLVAAAVAAGPVRGGELSIIGVEPSPRSLAAPVDGPIVVHFDRPVEPSSLTPLGSFWAFGKWSGTVTGSFQVFNGDQSVALVPSRPFSAGEQVSVYLSHDVEAQDGSFLRSSGYSFQFWTGTRQADLDFQELQTLTTNGAGESSRPYGGVATDMNGDGWLDLTMVNEDTFDLRVFLNRGLGDGTFDEFLEPTFPVGQQASPSEPSDFNRDGHADICVANIATNQVSVLLGNGDGTLGTQQVINVGTAARGIAVLDVDGDGDTDIVNTNAISNNLSLLINNGAGVFSAPTFFEGGAGGEWALMSADMDEDGLLDLVVGARDAQQLIVQRNNGDTTFTQLGSQSAGGAVWMIAIGDVNGDGHEDVAGVNSSSGNCAIVLGDGAGNLSPPQTYTPDPFALATDLGDIDGDGDLDWVTSSFGGDWLLFLNDGSGSFAFEREFDAPSAASCAVMCDIDNDRDLDLALVDEIADVLVIVSNGGATPAIPAMGTWGAAVMLLGLLAVATVYYGRSRAGSRVPGR